MTPEVAQIPGAIQHGAPPAPDELLPLVYAELRALARAKMPAGTLTTPLRDGTLAPQTHLP